MFLNEKSEIFIEKINHYGSTRSPFFFIVDFDLKKPLVYTKRELEQCNIYFEIENFYSIKPKETFDIPQNIVFEKKPIAFEEYQVAFEQVLAEINYGNSFLLNLTCPTKVETNLTLQQIYQISQAKYKLFFGNNFVCFSPETFVQIRNGRIFSYPMKGTINAKIPDAEAIILDDKKEKAEHYTIVDLIRNDLSKVARRVHVEKLRYIDKITTFNDTLLQVSSKIVGDLEKNYQEKLGDIIFKLLPAGSVSGAPKAKTYDIIKTNENYERGYFTGIFGYFDGESLDSAVMIRFLENIDNQFYFKSGGGITSFSKAQAEYQEMLDKVYLAVSCLF